MNKLVIIPVCNFNDLTFKIRSFYENHLNEADVIDVQDNKLNGLKASIILGYSSMEIRHNKQYDLIIINEHDVIPNEKALYAALSVFENNYLMKGIASVSTIYKWNNIDCYPTNPNWYNGWTISNSEAGECKIVGITGVPFGLTLWKPEALKLIENKDLPNTLRLDTEFGKLLYNKGYHHIRLVDYYVEHYKRGVKSWKN